MLIEDKKLTSPKKSWVRKPVQNSDNFCLFFGQIQPRNAGPKPLRYVKRGWKFNSNLLRLKASQSLILLPLPCYNRGDYEYSRLAS